MNGSSLSGTAQAMPRSNAGSEPLKSGRTGELPESERRIRARAKVRIAAWFVMSLLLLITAVAVALNRFDFGFDEVQASEVQREFVQAPTVSRSTVDVRDILDDAQREAPRGQTAPPS